MFLPDDAAVRAKVVELGLAKPDGPIGETVRRTAIQAILAAEQEPPAAAAQDEGLLLSSSRIAINDGYLVVEVRHFTH